MSFIVVNTVLLGLQSCIFPTCFIYLDHQMDARTNYSVIDYQRQVATCSTHSHRSIFISCDQPSNSDGGHFSTDECANAPVTSVSGGAQAQHPRAADRYVWTYTICVYFSYLIR